MTRAVRQNVGIHAGIYLSDKLLETMSDRMPVAKAGYIPERIQILYKVIGSVECQ